jgi:hypothetical protein
MYTYGLARKINFHNLGKKFCLIMRKGFRVYRQSEELEFFTRFVEKIEIGNSFLFC